MSLFTNHLFLINFIKTELRGTPSLDDLFFRVFIISKPNFLCKLITLLLNSNTSHLSSNSGYVSEK